MTCPSCSATVPEQARFCPSCGHALQAPSDERRVVTVLFGDLVGFTALSEARDPEQVKNLVDRCFERLAVDITSYGGRVDKIVGDAVVALFGAPVAHEDDAERAVRAALAMQRTLGLITEDLDVPVRMRIGINSGEVLVGALRTGGDYTAMGDVVNTASRLQTTAQPGQVVVGAETWAATRGVVRYESLGRVQARGREEPVEAYLATGVMTPPGRRPRRSRSPLVGRASEMGMLCNAVRGAVTYQRPCLALVVGDAGMGKSRLVQEVLDDARTKHGAQVLAGRSVPYGEANSWWPLAEAIAGAFGIDFRDEVGASRERALAGVAAVTGDALDSPDTERTTDGLLYLMGYPGALTDVDPARARDEASRAVRTYLEGAATHHPVVLSIADVQWADPLVLELIDDLLQRIRRLPVAVVLTARPDIAERWHPAPGRHNLVFLNLDPLEPEAAAEMLGALLESEPSQDVRTLLIERSGGNPFFLEELVALLTEASPVANGTPLTGLKGGASLPATLRGLVAARLDALPPGERALLEDAAVLGRRGPVAALEALSATRPGAACPTNLEALVARDLLLVENGFVRFGSDLVREVAYGILTKAERARRHATLMLWMQESAAHERADEVLEEVARHAALAAQLTSEVGHVRGVPKDIRDQAVTALEKAALRADDRESHLVAARLYDQQLRLLGDKPSSAHRHALVGRARARTALRQQDLARADIEVALAEARDVEDDLVLARALTVLGDIEQNEGALGASMETLEEAVALWRKLGDRRGEAAALRRRGMTAFFAGDSDTAEDAIGEALVAFHAIGTRKGIAWATQNLAWIAFTRGDTELADERLEAAISMFGDIGDWGGLGWARGLQAWVRFTQGKVADAERIALSIIDDAGERGDRWGVSMMTVLLASIRLWQGRAEEAIDRARFAQQLFAELGDTWGQTRAVGPLSRALLVTGRRAEAESALAMAYELVENLPAGSNERTLPDLIAAGMEVHMGEGQRALDLLGGVDQVRVAQGMGDHELASVLGTAMLQVGRIDEAVAMMERTTQRHPGRPALESALALGLAAAGKVDEARAHAATVAATDWATYLDRVTALLGLACAEARAGRTAVALQAVDDASELADASDDILTGGIIALAQARVLEAAGSEAGADAALAEADARLARVGIDAAGWDDLFRTAAGSRAVA